MPVHNDPDTENWEREKWRAELQLREKEFALKESQQRYDADLKKEEMLLKQSDASRSALGEPVGDRGPGGRCRCLR